jgi:hypothetical protein
MKPPSWKKLTGKQKKEVALGLMSSMRGKYIMSQALHYGIKSLKAVRPVEMQERSNIEDMEMLTELFDIPIMEPREVQTMLKKYIAEKDKPKAEEAVD